MKIFTLRSVSALALSVLLGACGVGNPSDMQLKTAATIETSLQSGTATASVPATGTTTVATATGAVASSGTTSVASANMPQPDCIADGCKGLRIIDGNAEAFRYAAMQRNEAPQT